MKHTQCTKNLQKQGENQGTMNPSNKPLKRVQGLESWPFPTFKGQPLEPVIYPKQPRIDDSWEEALL
jgi:hypothetical protein